MHTPEQAKELWCPMARITQIGAVETSATYNRALIKSHIPIALRADEGGEGGAISATVLKVETQISVAARCLGAGCAMWRWLPKKDCVGPLDPTQGYCGLAPVHGVAP